MASLLLLGQSAYAFSNLTEVSFRWNRIFSEIGIILGYGNGLMPEGRYQVILSIIHLAVDLNKYSKVLRDHQGRLSVLFEPQFNEALSHGNKYELGIGLGLKYEYLFSKNLSANVFGALGPHYSMVKTVRQARGFIFSDTVGCGLSVRIANFSALLLGYRYRHLSNAGLQYPNGGINTHIVTTGYSFLF